jgi:phage shock protein A
MGGVIRRLVPALKRGLGALLAPAEDPRQIYAPAHLRQRLALAQVQQALAAIAASRAQLAATTERLAATVRDLAEQARQALIAGREDQARDVLRRRQASLAALAALRAHTKDLEQEEHRLSRVARQLAAQVEAVAARRELAAARYVAAEAEVRLGVALAGISAELAGLGQALQRAEERAELMQARAAAIQRLVQSGALEVPALAGADPLDAAVFQAGDAGAVERQLAALKAQLRPAPADDG